MSEWDYHGSLSEEELPEPGEDIAVTYLTTQGATEKRLVGEVIEVWPVPNGWIAEIDTYQSERRRVVVDDGVIEVQAPTDASGQYIRLGLSEIGDQDG